MTDEQDMPRESDCQHGEVVKRLVEETGITLEQARRLVGMLGVDWSSLVREARLMLKSR